MRTLFFALILTLFIPAIYAQQDDRNFPVTMSIGDFRYDPKKETVGSVLGQVLTAVTTETVYVEEAKYLPIVEQAFMDAATRIARLKMSDCTAYTPGSDYTADCRIISIGYKTDIPSKEYPGVSGIGTRVTCFLTLKDAETGEIWDSHQFNASGWDYNLPDAMSTLSRKLSYAFSSYLSALLPVYGTILERGIVKKQKVKDVYISAGSNLMVPVGAEFGVYDITTIAGRESRKRIGQLKVKEVSGPDLSWCKVSKGGDKIQAAMEDGRNLTVVLEKL